MIVVGIGGEDGFVNYEVLERKRPKKKGKSETISQNPKDDMSNQFFTFPQYFCMLLNYLIFQMVKNLRDGLRNSAQSYLKNQ